MVEARRAYRRWFWKRLGLLTPTFILGLGVTLGLAIEARSAPWAKVTALTMAVLILCLVAHLLFQTIFCARHHAEGRREIARSLRRELRSYPQLILGCVALLGVLILVPEFLPERSNTPEIPAALRPPQPELAKPEAKPAAPAPDLQPRGGGRKRDMADASSAGRGASAPVKPLAKPAERPIAPHVPTQPQEAAPPAPRVLTLEAPTLPRSLAQAETPDKGPEDDLPKFELNSKDISEFLKHEISVGVQRLGLPADASDEYWPLPEFRLDAMVLTSGDLRRGGGAELVGDIPFGKNDSIRATYSVSMFTMDESFFSDEFDVQWQRTTLQYVRRITGYTQHAEFDLSVSIGLSSDTVSSPSGKLALTRKTHLSPYVGVDMGIWQEGPVGLVFHAGQSIPINLNRTSASVTDVSATVRVDLSERVSIHAGYRLVVVSMKTFDEPLARGGGREELDDQLAGPVLGVDIRF